MRYTQEITDRMVSQYKQQVPVQEIATELQVPERSIIAKLSSLGVYTKKPYLNKRGETPVKKSEQITKLAKLLEVDETQLESLEKVNKTVLELLATNLTLNRT
jgi:Mn-dependent DtxR family transcriptional regulator